MEANAIQLFRSGDLNLEVKFSAKEETVWLTRRQMAKLYDRDVKTIGRHITNALEDELDETTVAKFATVQKEGGIDVTRQVEHYNLDMIISVGYRVKSQRGVEFRRWANRILKDYILRGVAVNRHRLDQLGEAISIMSRVADRLDVVQVLDVVKHYTAALDLLDDYDHQRLAKPAGREGGYRLGYDECRHLIESLRFGAESELFGNEKDDSFKGSLGAIYQSFGGAEVYPTVEEKAANLLYFITKNHSFSDGNKRIAAAVFLYFLEKNGLLHPGNPHALASHTLVAVVVMIAESRPEEKETMVKLVMNFLAEQEKK